MRRLWFWPIFTVICVAYSTTFGANILVNGDFEATAIVGVAQTPVGVGEFKKLYADPLLPGYSSGIAGIPNWTNSFADVGFGPGVRDAGLSRFDFAGSGNTQYAYINNWETRLSQTTSHLVAKGETYAASVQVGFFNDSQAGRFQLWAGGPSATDPDVFSANAVLLAEVSVGGVAWNIYEPDIRAPANEWFTLNLTYTPPVAGLMIGLPLTVSVLTSASSVGPPYWDNATLTVAVPEPQLGYSVGCLLLFGLTARLTHLRRRKAELWD